MSRSMPNHVEVIAIYEELKLVIKKTGDDKCEYLDGHDDSTVAKKVGGVTATNVANLRRAKFGKLIDPNAENRLRQVSSELERMLDLHAKILGDMQALQAKHDDLQQKHDLLCTQLSASRVVDARHLRVADPHEQRRTNGAAR